MNKTVKILSLSLLALGLTGCDLKANTISAKTFFQTAQTAEKAVAAAPSFGFTLENGEIDVQAKVNADFDLSNVNVKNAASADTKEDHSTDLTCSYSAKDLNISSVTTGFGKDDTTRKASLTYKANTTYAAEGKFNNETLATENNTSASVDMGLYVEDDKAYLNLNNTSSVTFLSDIVGEISKEASVTQYMEFDNINPIPEQVYDSSYISDLLSSIEDKVTDTDNYTQAEKDFYKSVFTFSKTKDYSILTVKIDNDNKLEAYEKLIDSNTVKEVAEKDSLYSSYINFLKSFGTGLLNAIDFRKCQFDLALNDSGYAYFKTDVDLGVNGSGAIKQSYEFQGITLRATLGTLSDFSFKVKTTQNFGYSAQVQEKGDHDYIAYDLSK